VCVHARVCVSVGLFLRSALAKPTLMFDFPRV
jgi:hypothetical protein